MSDVTIKVEKLAAIFPSPQPALTCLEIDKNSGDIWVVDDNAVPLGKTPHIFKISADGKTVTPIVFDPVTVDDVQLENIELQYDPTGATLKSVWVTSFTEGVFFLYDVASAKAKMLTLKSDGAYRAVVWHEASQTAWIAESIDKGGVIWAVDQAGTQIPAKKRTVGDISPWNLLTESDTRIWFSGFEPTNQIGYFNPGPNDSSFTPVVTKLPVDGRIFGMSIDKKNNNLWLLDMVNFKLTSVSLGANPTASANVIDLSTYLDSAWDLTCDDAGYIWIPTSDRGGMLQLNEKGEFVAKIDIATVNSDTDTALIAHRPDTALDYFILSDRNPTTPALYKASPTNTEKAAEKYSFVIAPQQPLTADSDQVFADWTIQVMDAQSGSPVVVDKVVRLELDISDLAGGAFEGGKDRLVIDTNEHGLATITKMKAAIVSALKEFDITVTTRAATPSTVKAQVNLGVTQLELVDDFEEAAYVGKEFAHAVSAVITPPASRKNIHFAIDAGKKSTFQGAVAFVDPPVTAATGVATTPPLVAGSEPETFVVTASAAGFGATPKSKLHYVNLVPSPDNYVWEPDAGHQMHPGQPLLVKITANGEKSGTLYPVKKARFQLTVLFGKSKSGTFAEDLDHVAFVGSGSPVTQVIVSTNALGMIVFGGATSTDVPYTVSPSRQAKLGFVQLKIKPLDIMPDVEKSMVYEVGASF